MGKIKNFSEYHRIGESQILLEKTFNIDSDVDYVFENGGFVNFLKEFNGGERPYVDELNSIQTIRHIVFDVIPSSKLQTEDCIDAHRRNPIDIYTGISILGSHYSPTTKSVFISLNDSALRNYYSGDVYFYQVLKKNQSVMKLQSKESKLQYTMNSHIG